MKTLLRSANLQAELERDGFAVTHLLSAEQVQSLLGLYHRHIQEEVSGLYESSRHQSLAVNRSINQAIRAQVEIAGQHLFEDCRIYGGTFMVKSHINCEVLPLHQDWTVVEKQKYQTFFLWCPLMDVSVRNGCLFVLPGSHRYFDTLRSGTYPSDRFILPPELHRSVIDVPLRAGEAIIYSDDVFHGSHANNGSAGRIVATARVMEKDAQLVYFHKSGDSVVDVYPADEDFYLKHIDRLAKGGLPDGMSRLYQCPYRHFAVRSEDLYTKIREHFPIAGGKTAMKELFRDARVQTEFETNGYAVIDFIDAGQVAELKAFYHGLNHTPTSTRGFQVSLDNPSPEFVRTVSEKLFDTVRASVEKHFKSYNMFTASFVTKGYDPQGVVPPHQDWTFVDEAEYWSATIWCPLVDVDFDNGALGVIKGSHRLYDHVRPSPSPRYEPPFRDQLSLIFPFLTLIPLKAGQAIVFNNKTIHGSPPNISADVRVAFGIGITQEQAPLRHYYMLPGRETPTMEGFEVTPEFFYSYNNARLAAMHEAGTKPQDLNSVGVFAVSGKRYEPADLSEAMRAAGNTPDPALIEKMKALFFQTPDGADKGSSSSSGPASGGNQKARRPFWKVYTPINILREIQYRLSK